MNPVVINDPGGLLGAHIAAGKAYAATKAFLAIKYCASACLMMLAEVPHDHVCVYRDAWIGTHSAAYYESMATSEDPATMIWERGKDWIAKGYQECAY